MLSRRSLPLLTLSSLLAACTLAPVTDVPVAPTAPQGTPVAAATATPAPVASDAATPAPTGAPSATPAPVASAEWKPSGVEPIEMDYEEPASGLSIYNMQYELTGSAEAGYRSKASMSVQLAGQPRAQVTFDEFDGPDTGSLDDQDDQVTVTDVTNGSTQTFGADQGLVNLWVGQAPPKVAYRVQQMFFPVRGFEFDDETLEVQFLGGGMYRINRYPCEMTLTDAAMACAYSPQLKDTSIAGLSALYAVLRERPFNEDSLGLEAFYRVRHGLPATGTRVPSPVWVKDVKKGSGFGRYQVMSETEQAQNPAAALLKAVIDLRESEHFDPEGGFEAVSCEELWEPEPV